jgi:uncharacterized protein YndB with AHSA1/START domain
MESATHCGRNDPPRSSASVTDGTHREIGRRRIAAGEARTILIRRRYEAPIVEVWRSCTVPERLGTWFAPLDGDLRVGGTFRLEGGASGEILRCEAPRLLRLGWGFGTPPVGEVELRLRPEGGTATVLELEHACVSQLVEEHGRLLDVVADVAAAWEAPLAVALTRYLQGRPPAPDDPARGRDSRAAWAALVDAANSAPAHRP